MNEYTQGIIGTLALVPSIAYSIISWLGGRPNGRVLKRIVAPLVFCILLLSFSIILKTFSFWYLLIIPIYMLPIGYGGDTLWKKLLGRSLWSLVRTAPALIFAIVAGTWTLFVLQLVIGLIVTLVMGILNPIPASAEEGLINFVSTLFIPYMVI